MKNTKVMINEPEKYMNPYTDFGFKKLFGTEPNKEFLISFLNALFQGRRTTIVDISYLNTEILGPYYGDRNSVFDVYCQTSDGGHVFAYSHEKGLKEGYEKGEIAGIAKGKELGIAEGKELGIAEGSDKTKRDAVRRMLSQGLDKAAILEMTGWTEEVFESSGISSEN